MTEKAIVALIFGGLVLLFAISFGCGLVPLLSP